MSRETARRWAENPANAERLRAKRRKQCEKRKRERAAKRAGLPLDAIPPDWHPHTITTVVGPDGDTRQQSIQARPDPNVGPAVPDGFSLARVSTLSNGDGTPLLQWRVANQRERERWESFWSAAESAAARYRGLAKPSALLETGPEARLLLIPVGDPHIGMLSWARETGVDFDARIAERECLDAIDRLLALAPPAARCVLANMGDFFHAEDDRQVTPTAGHKLDVDTRAGKVAEIGFSIARRMIDRALAKYARVEWIGLPGNHDPRMAYMLTLWLRAVYENEPRVEFGDDFNPFRYVRHGKVLIGLSHGDGAKPEAMPGIMAADRARDWGETLYHYVWQGHVHTRRVIEAPMCVVETVRTLAPPDFWTHWKGFRSGQSIQAVAYDAEYGEESRVTVDIRAVRA